MVVDFLHDKHPSVLAWRKIFNWTYYIRIKAKYAYTQWQLEVSGIPYTGNYEWDEQMANDINTKRVTIAELAELHYNDIPYEFVYRHELPVIHQSIKEYIEMMVETFNKEHLNHSRFKSDTVLGNVIDDLEKLADLANKLAPAVGHVIWDPNKVSTIKDKLKVRRGIMSRTYQAPEEKLKLAKEASTIEHISIADDMSSRVKDGSRMWRRRESR